MNSQKSTKSKSEHEIGFVFEDSAALRLQKRLPEVAVCQQYANGPRRLIAVISISAISLLQLARYYGTDTTVLGTIDRRCSAPPLTGTCSCEGASGLGTAMHQKCPFARWIGRTDHEQSILQQRMDTSKDERIAARRLRIQQKLATKQGSGAAGSTGAAMIIHEKTDVRIGELLRAFTCWSSAIFLPNAFGCFSGKAQIAESKHRLRRLLDEADDAVTMVRG